MSEQIKAYPLHWPEGWPRTAPSARDKKSAFQVNVGKAIDELFAELERLGAKNIVLSSNLSLTNALRPYTKQRQPDDPGIAVYFEFKGKPMAMARDFYADWRDNIRSLGLSIEAFRALHRHGGAFMMERAFTAFTALPAPQNWRDVLQVGESCSLGECEGNYKRLRKAAHPDGGGSPDQFNAIQRAIEQAREELRSHG